MAAAVGLAALPAVTLGAPADRPAKDLTKYVAALRQATKLAEGASSASAALSGKDCTRFGPAAAKLADAASAAQAVFATYAKAKTRYGTEEEIRLFGTLASDLVNSSRRLAQAAGETGTTSAQELRDAEGELGIFWRYLAERIQDRLEIAGLADVLTAHSFREIKDQVVAKLKERLKTRAEAEIRRLVGFRIKLDVPLREQIHDFLQAQLRQALTKLALTAGPAGIVVKLFGGQVISWLGAKLKEALRQKGRLDKRVATTISGFKKIEAQIGRLPGTAEISTVRRLIHDGQAALAATGFLKGDLQRAGGTNAAALLEQLTQAEKVMQAYLKGTRYIFLLDSPLLDENFSADAAYAARIRAGAGRLARKLGCPLTAGGDTTTRGLEAELLSAGGRWTFGRVKGAVLCSITFTTTSGKNGTHVLRACHPNESFWKIVGKNLFFYRADGVQTSRLTRQNANYWQGPYLGTPEIPSDGIIHYIRR